MVKTKKLIKIEINDDSYVMFSDKDKWYELLILFFAIPCFIIFLIILEFWERFVSAVFKWGSRWLR